MKEKLLIKIIIIQIYYLKPFLSILRPCRTLNTPIQTNINVNKMAEIQFFVVYKEFLHENKTKDKKRIDKKNNNHKIYN